VNQVYVCPRCKNDFVINNNSYYCPNCKCSYNSGESYIDFIPETSFYAGEVPKSEMNELLKNIDNIGYHSALNLFLQKFSYLRQYIADKKRVDWVYNVLENSRINCLDIGSGLGNISENLSFIFENVYSVEAVKERIEFQKRRFKNSKRSNIYISRGNVLSLPFKDNFFDFIVCNGVLEWIGMMNTEQNPRKTQIAFLQELKRVLKENGKIYVGIENRLGLDFILGAKDHSGLRYTSLIPRFLANFIVKRYGNSGGIYGDNTIQKKEERGYFTYTYTIHGYRSLFKDAGLKVRALWVYPSYNQPYFSGFLEDKIGIKGFVKFIKNMQSKATLSTPRSKLAVSLVSRTSKNILYLIVSIFTPSFLFYCGKSDFDLPIYKYLAEQTAFKSITSISEGDDIKYLLYDKDGTTKKIVHMKRDLKYLPERIYRHDRTNPEAFLLLSQNSIKIWMEDWIPGRNIDPLRIREAIMALDWIFNFQNTSKKDLDLPEYLGNETSETKKGIDLNIERDNSDYLKVIDEYKSYMEKLNVGNVPEHGDYFHGNILIDNTDKLYVIDWAYYRKVGDPFFDPVFFITQVIILFKKLYPNDTIGNILNKEEINKLKEKLNAHFGLDLDFQLLILYNIIRFIVRLISKKGIFEKELNSYYKLADELITLRKQLTA
jgi:SAM-dependent methyltransferase